MVRLKEDADETFEIAEIEFQFHYGSVKSPDLPINKHPFEVFQFHYGSVKSGVLNDYLNYLRKFQFHYGSVKSGKMD